MPRNGSGSYSLPEAAFVSGTVISSTAVNSDFSDIASALTGSLARDGQGGMTDVLPLDPLGFVYTNDPDTGMYRRAANSQAIKCNGSDIVGITTGGIDVAGTITQNQIPILPVGLGPLPWSGTYPPTGWVWANGQTLNRSTYSALWAFAQAEIALGNTLYTNGDGSTTFTVPDIRGRVVAGQDNMGASSAGRLTSTTMTPNGTTLGATGGAQTVTIAQANLPNVTLATTIGAGQGQHGHTLNNANGVPTTGTPGTIPYGGGSNAGQNNITVNDNTLPAMSGTTPLGGSGTAVDKIQPTILSTFIIFAGV